MTVRTAHPYTDLDVIDSRAPRTNQAIIGTLALLAFMIDLVAAAGDSGRPALCRAPIRPPLLPAVSRLLRADPATAG